MTTVHTRPDALGRPPWKFASDLEIGRHSFPHGGAECLAVAACRPPTGPEADR